MKIDPDDLEKKMYTAILTTVEKLTHNVERGNYEAVNALANALRSLLRVN